MVKNKGKKIKIDGMVWVILGLVPAGIFWISVIMHAGLGTDYVFDVVLTDLSKSVWGNTLITVLVIGGPGMAIGLSGMEYAKSKNKKYFWTIGIAIACLLLSFLAVLKKS